MNEAHLAVAMMVLIIFFWLGYGSRFHEREYCPPAAICWVGFIFPLIALVLALIKLVGKNL